MSAAADEMADRIRALIGHRPGITAKKMFGGYGFMLNGNMILGATKSGGLMMRVGPGLRAEALAMPGATPMTHGKREMTGFVLITDEGIADDDAIGRCIAFAESFVAALPPKA